MKKLVNLIIMLVMACAITGCGAATTGAGAATDGKIKVMCTSYPVYDWVKEIAGEGGMIEAQLLLDNGADIHSYQATAQDIAAISTCDVLIYVGGTSEDWVAEVVANAVNKDMKVLRLLDIMGERILAEEYVEGMQKEEHNHEHGKEEHGHDEAEYDEHVWLSLKNAQFMCEAIKNMLCDVDSGNADIYEVNYRDYVKKLQELDEKFAGLSVGDGKDYVVFGDRFPFRYLFEDYGIEYYAAFPGCSAETEASFETVTFLAGKIDEGSLSKVLVIESSSDEIAKSIISNTKDKNQEILVMDSLQAVTKEELSECASYLGVMEGNYDVLAEALK